MDYKALDEITTNIRNGLSIKQKKEVDGLPITRIETIADGIIDSSRVGYAGLQIGDEDKHILEGGDILFSHINSDDHIGKTAIYKGEPSPLIHGVNLLKLRPNKEIINSRYLYYALNHPLFRKIVLARANRSVNQSSISIMKLKKLKIPLPPLETQKKIAAILDKADALRQKRRQTIEKLDELTRSVFLDMFGDPDKNPKGWEIGKFSDLAIIERNSVSLDEFAEHNYYLGLQDIEKDTGKILDRTEGGKVDLKSNKYSFNQNHILYGKLRPYLNKVASPDFSGFCSTDILPIKPKQNISNKSFLTYLMRHQSFVKYADTKSSGANLPRISPKLVKKYPAILPPLQKQEEFSLKSIRIDWLKEKIYFQLEELNHLFNSLLQKAFKGELNFSETEEQLLAAEEAAEYSS